LAGAVAALRQFNSKRSERMQKKLLTVAVAGALAAPGLALAQVEVYGFVNMSVGQFKYSAPAAGGPSVSKWDVASHASNYGIRGRENVGGGQTMWFQIEQNAPLERSNNRAITPASRNSAVGIQGSWGNFFIGQWTTPWSDLDALWGVGTVGGWGPITSIIGRRETTGTAPNPNCQNDDNPQPTYATGQPACDALEAGGGVGHPFWKRISNSVFYQSPVMAGVQVKAAYQTNEGKATTGTVADPSMWSLSAQWAGMGGRVRVGAAIDRHKDFTTIGQTDDGFRITGGWNFGFADVGVAYERMTYVCGTGGTGCGTAVGDVEAKQWGVGVAVPVGMGTIRASYAFAKDLTGAINTDSGAKTYNVGYEHRFSKRSSVGVGYATVKNDDAAGFTWTGAPPNAGGASNAPAAGSDPSTFFVNFLHRF
jgi:predicted porin